jgi:hypothetical protein
MSGASQYSGTPLPRPQEAPKRDNTLLVVLVVVVGLVLVIAFGAWVDLRVSEDWPGGPGMTPIGTAFDIGNATNGTCPAASTFLVDGCSGPTHFYFRLAIHASTVAFGDVWFIIHASSGAIENTPGALGFTILSANGTVAAQYAVSGGELAMSSGWTYTSATTASSPLTTAYSIVIDMGTTNPFAQELQFSALGTGGYSGTTGFLTLP